MFPLFPMLSLVRLTGLLTMLHLRTATTDLDTTATIREEDIMTVAVMDITGREGRKVDSR